MANLKHPRHLLARQLTPLELAASHDLHLAQISGSWPRARNHFHAALYGGAFVNAADLQGCLREQAHSEAQKCGYKNLATIGH
jgi:hypothetical protein